MSEPNEITELAHPGFDPTRVSTLDTLYEVSSPQLCVSPAPAMLYYHGRDNAPFVFTGFDLWSWSRSDAQGLVDFVLGDIWGMSRRDRRPRALHQRSERLALVGRSARGAALAPS